jgi:DNA replication protein DnaC
VNLLGYGREVFTSAEKILRERRRQADEETDLRREAFFSRFPQAREIERSLASTAVCAAKAVLGGKSAAEHLLKLKEQNQVLQSELSRMLKSAGLPDDYLNPHYRCADCMDTGYIDGRMCACMKKLLRSEAYNRLNALTPLALSTFESFSLEYYPDRADPNMNRSSRSIMREILLNCEKYAETFSRSSQNLLMQGTTGLGKTHLSLAIANQVIQKGFGVVYGSVSNITSKLENEHFGRNESEDTLELLKNCDLLILDDLGTEFKSTFSTAAVYNIVNTRLLMQKPTIISTNLSMRELQERYSDRFASRVAGSFVRFMFVGHDNRMQKLLFEKNKN